MRPRLPFAAVLLALAAPAAAQPDRLGPDARAALRPAALPVLARSDSSLVPPTVRRGLARVDAATGAVRADYRLAEPVPAGATTPEAAARAYLAAHAARYGLRVDAAGALADLRTEAVVAGVYDHHVAFRQVYGGLPVFGRSVHVSLARDLRPLLVVNGYAAGLGGAVLPSVPPLAAAAAVARFRADVLAVPADVSAPTLVVFPGETPRLAWRLTARTDAPAGEWEAVLDATTGATLYLVRLSVHAGKADAAPERRPLARRTVARLVGEGAGPRAALAADGAGLVFDPDPLSSAGVPYGTAGFTDGGDADTPELLAQRREVPLRGITLEGGRYVLKGPYVEITGAVGAAYTPPAETRPDGFRYTRADDRFEAVMAYYHVDASQRRVQALDVGRPIHARPVRVNPQGTPQDNSFYFQTASPPYIVFGTGAVDDGEDAGIVHHEYGHALLDDQQGGLFSTTEGRALHEGWADYWANAYTRGLLDRGQGAADPKRLFVWDGNVGCWQGRRLDHPGTYHPTDRARMRYPAAPNCGAFPDYYQWGVLWATTLAEVRDALGGDVADRLALASLAYLAPALAGPPPFEVAAEALLAADRALYGGAHAGVLVGKLAARGYLDAADYGPTLRHTPLASTEQAGGTVPVEVEAEGASAPVARVAVVYRYGNGPMQTVVLAPAGGARYAGALPLPASAAEVFYHVEATDTEGRTTRLPADAPAGAFRFAAGPDAAPPALAHAPPASVPVAAFPLTLTATATDALGVDTVTVAYALVRAGATVRTGTAGLARDGAAGAFRGTVPLAAADVAAGDELRYTVTARDRAAARNTTTAGPFRVPVAAEGVLAAFDAEADGAGVVLGGAWRRGAPAFGVRVARAGTGVFSTGLAGPYPAEAGVATLDLPPLDLRSGPATLAFWHHVDTEHGGQCRGVCDGGNVQVSLDGGLSWSLLEVDGGYPDTVDARLGGGLAGRPVFGRFSHGWQRATARLPQAPGVRVRFAFGTDRDNAYTAARGFAGWALDALVVTTGLAPDAAPPALTAALPDAAAPGAWPALVVTTDADDVVFGTATWEVRRGGAVVARDSVRLDQDAADLRRFAGTPAAPPDSRPGDDLALTVRLRDADGNATTRAFAVPVRLVSQRDVLAGLAASGVWRVLDGRWNAAPLSDTDPAPRLPVSSLVLAPLDLPANAEGLRLDLRHRYRLGTTGATSPVGANVKVSVDGGPWTVLDPASPPAARLAGADHPMAGEPVFTGATGPEGVVSTYALVGYGARQVRLRLDLGTARPLGAGGGLDLGEFWTVDSATLVAATRADGFDVPRTTALGMLFPNPFRDRFAFAYTVGEAAPVTLALYDALGRRVRLLVDGAALDPGTYPVTLDGAALPAGVYFLRLTVGARAFTRQAVRVR